MADAEFMADLLAALPDAMQRLGLVWGRRTAVVINGADPTDMRVIFDGDKSGTVVSVYSMIGGLPATTRVYVDSVPPAGQYISGVLNPTTRRNIIVDTTVSCDTPLTIAAGSGVDTAISGLSLTVTNMPIGARWTVTSFLDIRETVAGTTLMLGSLYLDGVQWTDPVTLAGRVLTFGVSAITDRATPGQVFGQDTFTTPGSHTFDMRIQRTVAAGTQVIAGTNSTMRVEVYT